MGYIYDTEFTAKYGFSFASFSFGLLAFLFVVLFVSFLVSSTEELQQWIYKQMGQQRQQTQNSKYQNKGVLPNYELATMPASWHSTLVKSKRSLVAILLLVIMVFLSYACSNAGIKEATKSSTFVKGQIEDIAKESNLALIEMIENNDANKNQAANTPNFTFLSQLSETQEILEEV